MSIVLWIVGVLLVLAGIAGIVFPALPGHVLIFAGLFLAAWADNFTRVSGWTLALIGVIGALSYTVDFVAAALGAKRVGASARAIFGAAVGTIAGIFTGLWGLLFMPLVGAAIGEYSAQRDLRRAGKVGVATWIGLLLGTAVKIAIVFAMVGIFVAALLV